MFSKGQGKNKQMFVVNSIVKLFAEDASTEMKDLQENDK